MCQLNPVQAMTLWISRYMLLRINMLSTKWKIRYPAANTSGKDPSTYAGIRNLDVLVPSPSRYGHYAVLAPTLSSNNSMKYIIFDSTNECT